VEEEEVGKTQSEVEWGKQPYKESKMVYDSGKGKRQIPVGGVATVILGAGDND
jgi:hypothetical protein